MRYSRKQNQLLKRIRDPHTKIKLSGSIPITGKKVSSININLYSDANLTGVCTVPHAVVYQQNILRQNLTNQ